MAVVTTRPNATVASSGMTATGAASRHAALNDDSDSSYVTSAVTEYFTLGFAEPTIPAGGLVKAVALRQRCKKGGTGAGTPPVITFYVLPDNTDSTFMASTISWTTITTVTVGELQFATTPTNLVVTGVHTYDSAAALIYELFVDTTYVAKPVTAPSAPTGTVTTTNVPTVEWANTLDADGGAQTHYQVRVFTSAQYGAGGFNAATSTATWDSGDTVSSSLSAQVTTPLADGTYRAYVRVGQTVNGVTHWSDYAYTGFVIDVDLPAVPDAPTLTVQTGRIKVHVEGNSGGAATTTHLEVQRSEDGATWEPLRLTTDTDGAIAGTSADAYDYEAPNGTLMSYRVRALHEVSPGNNVASDWAATSTATWTDTAWWLKCPEQPALNMIVYPDSLPGFQRPVRQGVFQALGSTETVIVADTRGAARGTLRLQIDTQAEQDDLDALLDANATLLLQGPPAHHWPDRYLRIGDQDRARWIDKAWVEPVVDTLPWWEVARPDGVVVAWPA